MGDEEERLTRGNCESNDEFLTWEKMKAIVGSGSFEAFLMQVANFCNC